MKSIIIATLVFICAIANAQPKFSLRENNLFRQQIDINSFRQELNPVVGEKKSVPTAVLYSLLLPGTGELYADNYRSGKYFTIAEGALWITLIGFDQYGRWLQKDARNYAVVHAGISTSGKSDRYFVDIGEYMSIQDYNQQMLRDRTPHKVLDEHSSYAWNWDTKPNQLYYRNQRIASDQAFNDTKFVVAAIVINHLVSAIDAARMVILQNKQIDATNGIDIHADVLGGFRNPHGITVSFTKYF